MVQHSLLQYFLRLNPKPPITGACFHDLPETVRQRVYLKTGLIRDCPISLNFDADNQPEDEWRDRVPHFWRDYTYHKEEWCYFEMKRDNQQLVDLLDGTDCVCRQFTPIPFSLFFVSRSVSYETLSIFYSRNKFILSGDEPSGLSCLRMLSPDHLSSITSLTISLTSCSCVPGHICNLPMRKCSCHLTCKRGYDDPLTKGSRRSKRLAEDLERVCDRFAEHGNPSRLHLAIICDCKDAQTAEFMVRPLSAFNEKPLQECAIRLGQKPSVELRKTAEQAARRATGRPTRFRFTDLPDEIQFRILEFSELVAPCDLVWSPKAGLYGQVACCLSCTDALEACCCPQLHAGYSTTCTRGNCWQFPHSLFLLTRKIHTSAVRIFYRMNHFVIVSGQERPILPGYPGSPLTQGEDRRPLRPSRRSSHDLDPRVSIYQFLCELPHNALRHLRSLHWILDDHEPLQIAWSQQLRREWQDAILLMKRELDLRNFSLTIDMSRPLCQENYEIPDPNFVAGNIYESTLQAYRYLGTSLKPLRDAGLPCLFIHITYPFDFEYIANFGDQSRFTLEVELEKSAMGEAYDSRSFDPDVRIIRSRPHELIWARHAWWSYNCCKTRVDLEDYRLINDNRPVLSHVRDDEWYERPPNNQLDIWSAFGLN